MKKQKTILEYVQEARLQKNEATHKENDWSNLKPILNKIAKSLETISYKEGRAAVKTIGYACNALMPLQQYVNSIYQQKQSYIDDYTKKDYDEWLKKATDAASKL